MKATREMIHAVARTCRVASLDDARDAAQAMLDLIDPVPADVDVIYDRDGVRWARELESLSTWYMFGTTRVLSITDIVAQFGPITWDGKREA